MKTNETKLVKKQAEKFQEIAGRDLNILDALMENTDAHLAYLDADFNFVLVNSTYAKGSGYTKKELIGKNHFELFPNKENEQIFKKAKSSGKTVKFIAKPFLFPAQTERGVTYWNWSLMPIKNELGKISGFAFSLEDVTISKKREKRLAMQIALSKLLAKAQSFESIKSEILKIICEGLDWQVGEIWKIDKYHKQLLLDEIWYADSFKNSEFIKQTKNISFRKGEGLPGRVWSIKKPFWIENILKDSNFPRKNSASKLNLHGGFAFPVIANNQINGIMGFFGYEIAKPNKDFLEIVYSISAQLTQFLEHKKAEKNLEESEKKYRGLFNSVTDGIARTDIKGNILECNHSYCDMLFYSEEEIKKLSYKNITPLKWHKMEDKIVKDVIMKKGYSDEYEKEYIRKDGKIIPIAIKVWLIKNERGKNIGMWGFVRDITDRKELGKKKDEFISVTSHELKTPLTTLKAFSQILEKHLFNLKDEKGIFYLSKINMQTEKILSLIKDLLDVSKIQSGKLALNKQLTNVDVIVESSISDIQAIAQKHKIIKTGKANVNIFLDRERINQVIVNFLINAIKYSPNADKIIVKVAKRGKEVIISVRDFGIGIPEKNHKTIFERYMQIESRHNEFLPSLGLGLYISAEIISRHQGKIWIKSKVNQGSTFYFSLPILSS